MSVVGALVDGMAWMVGGTVTGPLVARAWRSRSTVTSDALEPVCGCAHHLAKHDPLTGECYQWLVLPGLNSRGGLYLGSKGVRCSCRQYVGPKPPELVVGKSLGYTHPDVVALLPSEQRSDESREGELKGK